MQIQHDEVRLLAGQLQGLQAVVSGRHLVAVLFQIGSHQVYDFAIIVYYQDLGSSHVHPALSKKAGSA